MPIKTKAAALIITILSSLSILFLMKVLFSELHERWSWYSFKWVNLYIFCIFIFFTIPGLYLLKARGWAWLLSLFSLSALSVGILIFGYFAMIAWQGYFKILFLIIIPLIPFIILILDRNKFWKVAK